MLLTVIIAISIIINIINVIISIIIDCLQFVPTSSYNICCGILQLCAVYILDSWTLLCGTGLVISVKSVHYFAVLRNYPFLTLSDQVIYII